MSTKPVLDTKFVEEKIGRPPLHKGKVRETYDAGDGKHLLMVATDRVSAFDAVFQQGIPCKGEVLTRISEFWFRHTKQIAKNHLVSTNAKDFPLEFQELPELEGRAMLVKKTAPVKLECIVRGYLAGSGWKEYQSTQSVCGIPLPEGLQQAQKLPSPIFTPSTKAETGHDQNVGEETAKKIVGEEVFEKVKNYSLEIYSHAADYALEQDIIIADTKFEFGALPTGEIILIDEALTPDSSRFWPRQGYALGISPPSFDKQYLRDWLEKTGWDKNPPAPQLPYDVVRTTSEKYIEAFERLTNQNFLPISL